MTIDKRATRKISRTRDVLTAALSLVAGSLGSSAAAASDSFLIQNVRVFTGAEVIESIDVLTQGQYVVGVGPGLQALAGTQIIDATGKTLIPGLLNAHAHDFVLNELREALLFGVTTEIGMFDGQDLLDYVTCAGSMPDHADLVSASSPATPAGGHGTQFGIPIPTIESPSQAGDFVDARIADGAHHLKLIVEDFSLFQASVIPELHNSTVHALVNAAHHRGLDAVAHVTTMADAQKAIQANVDGLVHIPLDQTVTDSLSQMAKHKDVFVVPTLAVFTGAAGLVLGTPPLDDPRLSPWLTSNAIGMLTATFPPDFSSRWSAITALASIEVLNQQEVPLLAGTDCGNPGIAHGASMHHEMELLVLTGLSPVDALKAATSRPADRFHLHDRGYIAPGRLADLVLVNGNPTVDILATRDIDTLWKQGTMVDRESLFVLANQPPSPAPACP